MVMDERGQYKGIFHIKGGEPFVVPYLWDVIDRSLCKENASSYAYDKWYICGKWSF